MMEGASPSPGMQASSPRTASERASAYDNDSFSEMESALTPASASADGVGGNNTNMEGFKPKITDEAVQLDLPMADLMAYLQIVANNSSNLPLTRRDDPELGRTVSSLTAEEYAYKCSAFVPSNVRIIGGSFGRYGSVWDLPTSEVSSLFKKCACDVY